MTNLIVLSIIIIIFSLFLYVMSKKSTHKEPPNHGSSVNICPFDNNYCAILGKSMNKRYITEVCQNCPRYDKWIKRGIEESDLRDKIKKITS